MTLQTLDSLYQQAITHQLAGQAEAARAAYLALLEQQPDHADACHNLGMLEYSFGGGEAALDWLMNAVEACPTEHQYWLSLVEVLVGLGAAEHVPGTIDQAVSAGVAPAGIAALRHRASELLGAPAERSEVSPPAEQEGQSQRARARAILARSEPGMRRDIKPGPPLDKKLGARMVALFNAGDYRTLATVAQSYCRRNLGNPAGWHFAGMALLNLGDRLAGLESLLKANELFPGDPQLLSHLGSALGIFGYFDEADACYALSAANRHPSRRGDGQHLEALRNQVVVRISMGNLDGAEAVAAEALQLAPGSASAQFMMGQVLMARKRAAAAIPFLARATEFDPQLVDAFQDLGLAYFELGRVAESVATTELAVSKNPGSWQAFSNLLFFLTHDERQDAATVFRRHCEFSARFEAPLKADWRPHELTHEPGRKLRIGFVSGDFRDHAVAGFIEPILAHLDRSQFHLFGFHNSPSYDAVTGRIKNLFDIWAAVSHVSDRDLAEIIRAARIDILVDLSGHTAGNRLLTFARKPAPLQVSWIGYPATTGLSAMDYVIGDRFDMPEGWFDAQFTEQVLRLPAVAVFREPGMAVPVLPLPARTNGYITFGSFNRFGKISALTLDMWARAMTACAGSHMLIGSVPSREAAEQLASALAERGIAPERLRFAGRLPVAEYLQLHDQVDVILDTFPYNGGTTTNYALWMGVPVLTLRGTSRVSNTGAAADLRAGLDEFVARDETHFSELAAALPSRLDALSALRGELRGRIEAGHLHDPAALAADFGQGMRAIWQRWCAGEAPASLGIAS